MSNRYKGGVISATPPTLVAGAGASGAWTLEQQMQATAAGLWPVNGPFYIEDVFSTYLYTGNGSTQTITNGIDLAGKGGLTWIKSRTDASDHSLEDTLRTVSIYAATISSNTTAAQSAGDITGFTSSGFSLRDYTGATNSSGTKYASWTFRKQPKFFDVVTWSGNGTTQTLSHNLGSAPGFIIVKAVSGATAGSQAWWCYHQSMGASYAIRLNLTSASANMGAGVWGNNTTTVTPSATTFTIGADDGVNSPSNTYVAYLFAHDAGGFGLTGSDNVISCGSFNTGGSGNATVSLGYEPQWVLIKRTDSTSDWITLDTMRGWATSSNDDMRLEPNTSEAESADELGYPTSTGFYAGGFGLNQTWIYIAIRRGPMKVPTDATKVFAPVTYTGNGSSQSLTAGFPISLGMFKYRGGATNSFEWFDRLRGAGADLRSAYNYAELATTTEVTSFASNTQVTVGASSDTGGTNVSGQTYVLESFQRAPSFFDEVCYTGTGANPTNFNHNLGAVPELMILKKRSDTDRWEVYSAALGSTKRIDLNTDGAATTVSIWGGTPTTTQFSLTDNANVNQSGQTYVAYLFATCVGVSKVGSYTGTATTLQVDCGFTGGARFVLIKRTDSTGDWYVWDSARGIVSGNDPYLLLNSTAAEVTNTDYVDTYNAGFEISSTAPAAINANGGTFIFLAIA